MNPALWRCLAASAFLLLLSSLVSWGWQAGRAAPEPPPLWVFLGHLAAVLTALAIIKALPPPPRPGP